jgi:serine/threonine protein kinase
VIHRDIKPSNILVSAEGDPKLLDFGIVRLLRADADAPTATVTGLQLMTPEYASPEQVLGMPASTLTDVYSLGVVLYQLLTGFSPYEFGSRSLQEIAEAICRSEPKKPSTAAVERHPADGGGFGPAMREGSKEHIRKRLQGDLDNIVLMAIRKEPHRRYQSVEQFSEDIRRHLESLPVLARDDSIGYRLAKFAHRRFTFDVTSESLKGVKRPFTSFSAAAQEAGLSRIHAGPHFRTDHVAGKGLGAQVAESIVDTILLPR